MFDRIKELVKSGRYSMSSPNTFGRIEFRVGKIIKIENVSVGNNAAYTLTIDFGEEIGERRATLKLLDSYRSEELNGKKLVCILNFPAKRVDERYINDVWIPAGKDNDGKEIFMVTDHHVPLGSEFHLIE